MSLHRGRLLALFLTLLVTATGCEGREEAGDASGAIGSEQISEAPTQRPEETEVWEPEPRVVRSLGGDSPPSDATVLFSGTDLMAWTHEDGREAEWVVEDGVMTVAPGTGNIQTRQGFGDVQLHIEWRTPAEIVGDGQGRGNSGVFLMGRYELQVLDSHQNRTYSNGQAGSIYKQHVPLVNASRAPGIWQSYDVVFIAPRFAPDGSLVSPAYMTAFHNGVLIQNHAELRGPMAYIGLPKYEAHGDREPLLLQDHSNPVSFRNIWVREISASPSLEGS
ncbi:MAG: DUF1080 domain-containing protein [Gemmatimonadetes bacterium]|nr:DUF1080 domain-containing protein [Gemmatimonadota bacterium]NNM06407.1 DUF1080 domain-containing protein [Gemmatimonadota bacterium]